MVKNTDTLRFQEQGVYNLIFDEEENRLRVNPIVVSSTPSNDPIKFQAQEILNRIIDPDTNTIDIIKV